MATEMTLSLYSSGSVAFVGWRATTETVAVYSSAFRLYRLAVYFVTALANGLQGWVAEKQGASSAGAGCCWPSRHTRSSGSSA